MKKINLISGFLIILFIIIMILVLTGNMVSFDNYIYDKIINYRNGSLDEFFKTITKLGNSVTVMCMVVVLLLFLDKHYQKVLGITVLSVVSVNTIVKFIIRRARPDHLRLIKQGGYSFPSGHAMISIAIYGFLIYWIWQNINNKLLRNCLTVYLVMVIIGIGISRVYVGVHYPSDIIAGYSLALGMLMIIISNTHKLGENENDKDGSK